MLYLVNRTLQKASGNRALIARYHFFAQPVRAHTEPAVRASSKSLVRAINLDDPIVKAFPRPPHVIVQRFRNGATCFTAEHDGQFSGFLWLARNAYDEDEVRCRYELEPQASCAWDYDIYVEPRYRIGRTFARLWDAANAHLAEQGVRWSLSRISSFNVASIAAHKRLGITKLCSATFVVVGRLQVSFLPAPPYIHVSADGAKTPVIRLQAPSRSEAT
ncbi:GNAT family N-acetyltransferase [Thauera linaloolentis]|uniref:GNAT family N-acetyltransferase n=1 Tax=Thauera linaloolentis TaxID=76112 RepID=UPI001B7FE580|nr:GNAT family N-acetyltransferase [Thauera linaloolentis]MCM8566098.1 GNAT family N-acetyltransferase [Thauera linaloolentis]